MQYELLGIQPVNSDNTSTLFCNAVNTLLDSTFLKIIFFAFMALCFLGSHFEIVHSRKSTSGQVRKPVLIYELDDF